VHSPPIKINHIKRRSAMHAAAYWSLGVALRGALPVTPKRIRRGGNTGSFDLAARTERQLVASDWRRSATLSAG